MSWASLSRCCKTSKEAWVMEGEWRPRPLEEVAEPGGGFAFKNDDWPADGRVASAIITSRRQ
jgi:hypothetical protein